MTRLYLAPMEGLGSIEFRKMLAHIGGFDECCTEFIRIPLNPHLPSLLNSFDPQATAPILQAVQLMGVDPKDLATAASLLAKQGAHRVELNCGCPSNTVTGKGAGSSLLDTPDLLYRILSEMCAACPVPVTAKLRIGVNDDKNFFKNIQLVQKAGCQMLTLHARTKQDGYTHPARLEYIRWAKETLSIPVCGNGDITSPEKALDMLKITNCDHLMIGRQAAKDPFIFHKIRAHLEGRHYVVDVSLFEEALNLFFHLIQKRYNPLGAIKQLASFLFSESPHLKKQFLTTQFSSFHEIQNTFFSLISNQLAINL